MHTENNDSHHKNDDPEWSLIAEYSLSDGIAYEDTGAELWSGSLIKTMRVLGLSPETLNKIRGTIAWAARKAIRENIACNPNSPASFRLFCERKIMNSASHAKDHVNGGWGFYVIERDRDDPNPSYQEGQRVVELYLYREEKAGSR
jgi:hypothetical protein